MRPGLERLCEAYRTKASELGRDLLSLREAASSMAEACAEKREENMAAEAQVCVSLCVCDYVCITAVLCQCVRAYVAGCMS